MTGARVGAGGEGVSVGREAGAVDAPLAKGELPQRRNGGDSASRDAAGTAEPVRDRTKGGEGNET